MVTQTDKNAAATDKEMGPGLQGLGLNLGWQEISTQAWDSKSLNSKSAHSGPELDIISINLGLKKRLKENHSFWCLVDTFTEKRKEIPISGSYKQGSSL